MEKLDINKLKWNIPDEGYHAAKVMCYSVLSKYERGGFSSIPTLWDNIESSYLLIGSAIDTMVTEPSVFKNLFYVMHSNIDIDSKTAAFVETVFREMPMETFEEALSKVSVKVIANEVSYYANLKEETIIKKLLEDRNVNLYYDDLKASEGKKMLTSYQYQKVLDCVKALHSNPLSEKLLFEPLPENKERLFQVKFLVTLEGIKFKVMFDMIIVDHENKKVHIYDLKSTSKKVYEFPQSFVQFNYQIQDRLYYRALKQILKDNGFEDYNISNMRNIVVSTTEPDVLLFEFEETATIGELKYKDDIIMRDPYKIARELQMNMKSKYPHYISPMSYNSLCLIFNGYGI